VEKREGICVEQQNPRQARADEPAPALTSLSRVGAQSHFWLFWTPHFFVEPP